ncbi:hypothetical protein Bca4012_020433 [Brassica carinata]
MLMSSIKERDELALSQNDIAVKGFALALQFVFVEAVPALTEVVQESFSSSEADNEDDVLDPRQKRRHPSIGGGDSSRTRARKALSDWNEPIGEEAVQQQSSSVRETSVVSLSLDTESEDMSAVSSKERQPPQPLEFYFKSTEYTKTCKIQTKCRVKKTVDVIKKLKDELQGMWMLLMRTIRVEGEDATWFGVNGVPILYSMGKHALISSLDCHEYPRRHLKLGGTKFVDYYFGEKKKIIITDVEQKLLSMKTACNDRLKMLVLFFLGRVLAFECTPKMGEKFRISSDSACKDCPRMCKSRFTKSSMKGYPLKDIYVALGNTKVINSVLVPTVGEETLLARIIDPEPEYDREGSTSDNWNYWLNVEKKKIRWKELYESDVAARVFPKKNDKEKATIVEGSSSNSCLESSLKGLEERIMKAMREEFCGLNLTVETKLDVMNLRMGELEKIQRLLKRRAKKIEDRLTSIESKGNEEKNYEDVEFRHWDNFDYGRDEEKDKEKSEAGKKNSEMGEDKEKVEAGKNSEMSEEDEENCEKGEKDKEDVGEEEQEPEKDKGISESAEEGEENVEESDEEDSLTRIKVEKREKTSTLPEKEAEKKAEETPTPPRGRTKAAATRRPSHTPSEKWITPPAVEEPEKGKEIAVEAEKKDEEVVEEPEKNRAKR